MYTYTVYMYIYKCTYIYIYMFIHISSFTNTHTHRHTGTRLWDFGKSNRQAKKRGVAGLLLTVIRAGCDTMHVQRRYHKISPCTACMSRMSQT